MKKGELTAFLSLTFVLVFSFILGILEITVVHHSKNLSRLEADRAVFSLFGEYHKKLLEDYHVFAVEGSWGTGEFEEQNLIGKMHYYGGGDLEHEITAIQFLTDDHGQAFKEQVLEYMEQRYGVSLVREFTGMTEEWKNQSIQGQEMEGREDEIMDEIRQIKDQSSGAREEAGEESPAGLEQGEDPFVCMEKIEKSGLLSVVLPREMELSGKRISQEEQASHRDLRSGRGEVPVRQNVDGVVERLLFHEYILSNFSNAASDAGTQEPGSGDDGSGENGSPRSAPEKERSLSYEVEYMIAGKDSDKENLESVLTKIFFIRTALNFASLQGDSGRQSEAAALAAVISVILLMPEASEAVKQLILFVWAAGESVVDLRTLLMGRRTALVKTPENWQLPLSGLLTLGIGSEQRVGEDQADGISYEGYLRGLLFLEDPDETAMKVLDRVEENLKTEYGMAYFKADQCVAKIELLNTADLFESITYTFPVYFGYR